MRKEPIAVSIALHTSVVGGLLLLGMPLQPLVDPPKSRINSVPLSAPPRWRPPAPQPPGDAGGGARNPLPANRGNPRRAFVPPPAVARHERPSLTLPTGIDDAPQISVGPPGVPSGIGGIFSPGPGLNGTGDPGNKGIGPGPGGSVAGIPEKPSKWPELLYKIDPEYSEPARKIRHQGTVLLAVDVGPDGLPRNIRVVRGIGLGLDEKAIDAVSTWRFKPALNRGRPVAAAITVEVNFRLL